MITAKQIIDSSIRIFLLLFNHEFKFFVELGIQSMLSQCVLLFRDSIHRFELIHWIFVLHVNAI